MTDHGAAEYHSYQNSLCDKDLEYYPKGEDGYAHNECQQVTCSFIHNYFYFQQRYFAPLYYPNIYKPCKNWQQAYYRYTFVSSM